MKIKNTKLTLAKDAKKKMKDSIKFSNKSELVDIEKSEKQNFIRKYYFKI